MLFKNLPVTRLPVNMDGSESDQELTGNETDESE
jgi:hypothetical protein